jgi:hypothetical protein
MRVNRPMLDLRYEHPRHDHELATVAGRPRSSQHRWWGYSPEKRHEEFNGDPLLTVRISNQSPCVARYPPPIAPRMAP